MTASGSVRVGAALLVALLAAAPCGLVRAGGGDAIDPKLAVPSAKAALKAPPREAEALLGTWEVTRVLADLADQPHWGIRPGDAALLYRSMTIARDKIWFVGDEDSCEQTRWQALTTTWQALFQKSGITRTPSHSAPARATPQDYDLKVSPKQRIQAFLVCPAAAKTPSKSWKDAGWMALESPDTLVVRYSQQVLVVLRRRAPTEKPRASFPCEGASTPSDKAICGDVELAAWDRSVAEALRQVLAYKQGEDKAQVLREHMHWRSERDKCAADVSCLKSALSRRVTALNQE